MIKKDIKLLTKACRQILFSALAIAPLTMVNATNSIERLSLFVSDGTNVYENRQLTGNVVNTLPADIKVNFTSSTDANGETTWKWQLKNTSNQTYNNLRITGLIDNDIQAPVNTFFNEGGLIYNLDAPAGYIPSDRWEINEPGYHTGDLILRAAKGDLISRLVAEEDDIAMALSVDIGSLSPGEVVEALATQTENNYSYAGLYQMDGHTYERLYYNFYAKKYRSDTTVEPTMIQGGMLTTGAAIKDGDVWVWGFRGSAQQGNGVDVVASYALPRKVDTLSKVKSLSGGAYHLIALDETGNVYGWGQSGYGETGCPNTPSIYISTPCKVLEDAVQISTGEYFSIALDKNGQVWTWGHNLYGQLGNGSITNSQKPIAVNLNGETARLIGGAYEGGFAVTKEGHVWAWGDNEASGLGFKGSTYGVQEIVRKPTRVPNLDIYADKITYIAGGNGWGEALLDDGTVIGWGLHASLGQGTTMTNISSPNPVVIMKNVKQLYARYAGSIALTEDGKIYTWGQTGGSAFPMIYGSVPTLRTPYNNEKVVSVGGGKEHIFYETESGNVYGVGYNDLYKIDQTTCCAPIVNWPGKTIKLQ